ncbi:OTU domain-containing protein 5-A-like [Watersipora subatra]|uniref:OTU domain-containing protein 5-A-like n=1 Tax=Watersipora subatra TaxID=2589382 RepID=UPI00355AF392
MTILPKRNKRRLDQRDTEPGQGLTSQGNPGSLLELDAQQQVALHSTASGHSQIDAVHSHFAGHSTIQQRSAYNSLLLNHLAENALGSRTHASLAVDTKWKRSPPSTRTPLTASVEDKYLPSHKKIKRSRLKQKQSNYDYPRLKVADNHHLTNLANPSKSGDNLLSVANSVSGPYGALLSYAGSKASLAQLSPKMPGGAQHKSGTGQRSSTPESEHDGATEHLNAPSPGGCNSEDEHVPSQEDGCYTEELEKQFEVTLKKELGLVIRQMEMDGSCLFRAIADQVYGDQNMHDIVREHCINYMAKNADHFSQYVTEDFATYLQRKRQLGCHGNHMEMQALSEMYNRPIEVYQYEMKPMNTFHCTYRPESAFPIRVSYHRNTHYNSLVDPEKPTIGVGLGLSDFQPRMVEKNLVAETKASSENYQIEQAMLKDKLLQTDWEITDEAINEQVSRESYAQWLQDCQKQKRRAPACTVTGPSCSSGGDETVNWVEKLSPTGSPKHSSMHSPKHDREKSSKQKASSSSNPMAMASGGEGASSSATNPPAETKNFFEFEPFTVYNYNDNIGEGEALARALAESQQDYINQVLKK